MTLTELATRSWEYAEAKKLELNPAYLSFGVAQREAHPKLPGTPGSTQVWARGVCMDCGGPTSLVRYIRCNKCEHRRRGAEGFKQRREHKGAVSS